MVRFYDTPDWELGNARGIAEALRDEIGVAWRHMHRCRALVRQLAGKDYLVIAEQRTADVAERRLLTLIAIRREGMGRRPLGLYYESPSGQPRHQEELAQ